MLIGDAVYERDAATGEVFYDLDLGTIVDSYFNEDVGQTFYQVRWDGNSLPDDFGYSEYQLKKVASSAGNRGIYDSEVRQ